jgi:hypothetical protein
MKPKTTQIQEQRLSDREWVFQIPHVFQGSVFLEGLYIAGVAWILFLANLRAIERTENGAVRVAVFGLAAAATVILFGRALWICFADSVLTLRAEEVVLERRWQNWKSARRLVTAEVDGVNIVVSRWRSNKKQTVRGLEIKAGRRRIRFGWELNWEEKYWLSQEAAEFLAPFSAPLRETLALEERQEARGV